MVGATPATSTRTVIDAFAGLADGPARWSAALGWETPQVVQPAEQVPGTAELRATTTDPPDAGSGPEAECRHEW